MSLPRVSQLQVYKDTYLYNKTYSENGVHNIDLHNLTFN